MTTDEEKARFGSELVELVRKYKVVLTTELDFMGHFYVIVAKDDDGTVLDFGEEIK